MSAAALSAAASLFAATALAQTEVPNNWPLIPSGLSGGDQFRLMLVVEETRDATASGLGTYDSFVRGEISANGHASIRAYSSSFKVLGSSRTVDARNHTGTTGTGVPIYWLNGSKLADDYADFYDGSWTNKSSSRNEDGSSADNAQRICTGSNNNGTKYVRNNNESQPLGGSGVAGEEQRCRTARLSAANQTLSNGGQYPTTMDFGYFALSGVFEVGSATVSTVDSIAITSSPGSSGDYVTGDDLKFRVTFSEAVTVTGAPKLRFTVRGTSGADETRQAGYVAADSTATQLAFAYTVTGTDYDHDGVGWPGSPLDLNGGTITTTSTSSDADLASASVSARQAHKIHVRPDMESPRIVSSPAAAANGYVTGETIRASLTWDQKVRAVTSAVGTSGDANHLDGGTPSFRITLDSGEVHAPYTASNNDKTLYFEYEVQPADYDLEGLTTPGYAVRNNNGVITRAEVSDAIAKFIIADSVTTSLNQQTAHKVNVNRPTVSSLAVTSSPDTGDTYVLGEILAVSVTFSKAMTVDTTNGTPRIEMELQSDGEGAARTRYLEYARGSGSAVLVFEYDVEASQSDDNGIAIQANALQLRGGTIRDSDGTDAVLDHDTPGTNGVFANHKINGGTMVAVTASFDAATYTATEGGTEATVTVNLSEDPQRQVVIPIGATGANGGRGADFSLNHTTLTIESGSTSATFKVKATDDHIDDDGETVTLTFDGLPMGVTAGSQGTASVTLIDDDTRGVIYDPDPLFAKENNNISAPMRLNVFSVKLRSQPSQETRVDFVENGGVGNWWDITPNVGNSIFFNANNWDTPQYVNVISTGDSQPDQHTTFVLSIDFTGGDYGGKNLETLDVTIVDTTKPRLKGAPTINADSLVLTYNQDLDADSVPPASAFAVTVAGASVTVNDVSISGKKVTLSLQSAAEIEDTVTVSYTVPTSNWIQDPDENIAAALTDRAVTNNTPESTPPALSSASIVQDTLVLEYDEALDTASTPATGAFAVTVAGSTVTVTDVAISGSNVTLTLASAAVSGDAVSLSYTVPNTNPIRDLAENTAAALSDQSVTNDTIETTAPTLSSASVSGVTLVLDYDEALDTSSTPANTAFAVTAAGATVAVNNVAVNGSRVTLTLASAVSGDDTVSLSYTVPNTNPIRDLAENAAAALSGQSVANNTDSVTDATLSSLSLSDGNAISLAPVFAATTTAYEALVTADVARITIAAMTNNAVATVAFTPSTDADPNADGH